MERNNKISDRSVAVGNGKMCAFLQGADITQIFGPDYSTLSFFSMRLKDKNIYVKSHHLYHSPVRVHEIFEGENKIGTLTDWIDCEDNIFYRAFDLNREIGFRIQTGADTAWLSSSENVLFTPKTACVFFFYPSGTDAYLKVSGKNCSMLTDERGAELTLQPGKGRIAFATAYSVGECEDILAKSIDSESLNRTVKHWNAFFDGLSIFGKIKDSKVCAKHPEVYKLLEEIALAIKVQQSDTGAYIAGEFYHLCYVRDQYYVSRYLIAFEMYEEARKLLSYYFGVFKKYGHIKNAQDLAMRGVFHEHENDSAEITSCLILQAFDYYKATKDKDFIDEIMPMLLWANGLQNSGIHNNMLSFNGDETYVAGGLLPRTCLNDGSSEATFLYFESEKALLFYLNHNAPGLIKPEWENNYSSVKNSFLDNFFNGKIIITNNPKRRDRLTYAETRKGVCEDCGSFSQLYNSGEYYVCPACLNKKREKKTRDIYSINAVALTMLFIDNDTVPREILKSQVKEIEDRIRSFSGRAVGYEYGMLLDAKIKFGDNDAEQWLETMIDIVDESGVYSEYYDNGRPTGCSYRPWESAVNAEAILRYIRFCENK